MEIVQNQLIQQFGNYIANRPFSISVQDNENSDNDYTIYMNGLFSGNGNKQITITQYATASGLKVSDHAYREPETWQCTLFCGSDFNSSKIYRARPNSNELEVIDKATMKQLIKEWADKSYRLNITTYEEQYTSMVIANIAHDEGSSLGVYKPTINFQEVRIATIQQRQFPASKVEKANNANETNYGADNGSSAESMALEGAKGLAIGAGLIGAGWLILHFIPGANALALVADVAIVAGAFSLLGSVGNFVGAFCSWLNR